MRGPKKRGISGLFGVKGSSLLGHLDNVNTWNELFCVLHTHAFELSRTARGRLDLPSIPHSGELLSSFSWISGETLRGLPPV